MSEAGELRSEDPTQRNRFNLLSKGIHRFARQKPAQETSPQLNTELLPPMQIDFHFSQHITDKDFAHLNSNFSNYDIFIPEGIGWTQEGLQGMNDVSMGKLVHNDPNDKSHFGGIYRALQGKKVIVGLIDLPSDQLETYKRNKIEEQIWAQGVVNAVFDGDSQQVLAAEKMLIQAETRHNKAREDHMLSEFPKLITQLVQQNPALQGKESLKVLLTLGSDHTRLYNVFKRLGFNVTRRYPHLPYIYSYESEVRMKSAMGKTIDDSLIEKVIFEKLLRVFDVVGENIATEDFEKFTPILRSIIGQLQGQDIKDIIESLKGKDPEAEWKNILTDAIKNRGIEIPTSNNKSDKKSALQRRRRLIR